MASEQSIEKTLSKEALSVIESYRDIPYFNNKRQNIRFGLRARVGKGTAEKILDEAEIFAMQEKVDWKSLYPDMRKKFLVDHKLGVDCSAFAYYVLDAESQARGLGSLSRHLSFPFADGILPRLGRILLGRYVENANVRTFAHPSNSHPIDINDIQPGDFLIRLSPERNHIMVVMVVEDKQITIVHSEARIEDSKYKHGIRTETIPLSSLSLPLHRLNGF